MAGLLDAIVYSNGDAAPQSTGIKIVGTVAHGNLIKIIAGNDVNFGADGPDLFCSMKMDGMTIGTDLTSLHPRLNKVHDPIKPFELSNCNKVSHSFCFWYASK